LRFEGVARDEALDDGFDSERIASGARDAPENNTKSSTADLLADLVVSVECFAHLLCFSYEAVILFVWWRGLFFKEDKGGTIYLFLRNVFKGYSAEHGI